MAEPQTVNGGLIVPNTGDLVGTWGSAALNPDFVAVDGFLCGVQTISVASTPITLTSPAAFIPTPSGGPTQAQNAVIKFTGVLSGNVTVTLPLPGTITVHNLTTGSFVLAFAGASAGQIICVDQGSIQRIYNDGTNVYFVDLPAVGSFLDLATTTVPLWIQECTVAPYLYCNGATFSAVTYPYLNQRLGGNTLPDLRGRSRFFFNDATNRITLAGSGINGDAILSAGGFQSEPILQANLPNVSLPTNVSDTRTWGVTSANGVGIGIAPNPGTTGSSQTLTIGSGSPVTPVVTVTGGSITASTSLGGSGTALNVMPPATISGMCFIRAG